MYEFKAHLRNARKNPEKVFCFFMFRREYLSSVVNVLTNSVKISDPTIADSVQLNFPRIHEKIG